MLLVFIVCIVERVVDVVQERRTGGSGGSRKGSSGGRACSSSGCAQQMSGQHDV